jgi:iron complex outermembrane receptor protein
MKHKKLAVKALCAGISLALAQAHAQTTPPGDGQEKPKPRLETISVTADPEKGFRSKYVEVGSFRDQEILDVPATVNVIPRTVLDAQAAEGLFDALRNTSGVTRSQLSGTIYDNIAIRGITVDNRTNFRLNGSLPVNNLIAMPIENKDRVEVLKGSSALYYGFTNPSGIVNMVTKRAKPEPVTTVQVSGNEYGEVIGHLDIGRQFGPDKQFGVRLNVAGGELRSAIKDAEGDRSLAAVALDWKPIRDLSLKLDVERFEKSATEQAFVTLLAPVNGVVTLPELPDPTKLISSPWVIYDADATNVLARADYTINDSWLVIAEYGRAQTNRDRFTPQFLNYNLTTGQGTLRVSRTVGQEFVNKNLRTELAGRVQTGFLDHELIVGYTHNERSQNGIGSQVFNLPQNLYNPVTLPEQQLTQALTRSPQEINDKGVYVFDRLKLGEAWQILVGARYSDYKNQQPTTLYAQKETSPSAGVIYRVRPDTSVYANYIEGLEEGGTAPINAVNALEVLPPNVSEQFELGMRTEAIKGMLFSIAYFQIDRASAYLNAANRFVADGRAEYRGVEFSGSGELTPEWSIYLSGLYLDAEQTQAQTAALIGKIPENTPKQSGSFFVEYRPAALPGFAINGGAFYVGERPANPLNQAFLDSHTLFTVGARYSMRLGATRATFQVNVENVADKRYWSAAGNSNLAQGLPRTVKAFLRVDF